MNFISLYTIRRNNAIVFLKFIFLRKKKRTASLLPSKKVPHAVPFFHFGNQTKNETAIQKSPMTPKMMGTP